jgi:hypothetical protein
MIEARFEMHGEEDREERIMMIDVEKNCFECIHLHADQQTCDAYPDGIPTVFMYGDKVHTVPYPGDHGIRFCPMIEHDY